MDNSNTTHIKREVLVRLIRAFINQEMADIRELPFYVMEYIKMKKKKIKRSDKKFKIVVLLASIYCIFGIITTQVEIKEQIRKLNSLKEKCNQKISDNES